jgi:hypothetical protein
MCNVHTYDIACTSPSEKICEGDKNSWTPLVGDVESLFHDVFVT